MVTLPDFVVMKGYQVFVMSNSVAKVVPLLPEAEVLLLISQIENSVQSIMCNSGRYVMLLLCAYAKGVSNPINWHVSRHTDSRVNQEVGLYLPPGILRRNILHPEPLHRHHRQKLFEIIAVTEILRQLNAKRLPGVYRLVLHRHATLLCVSEALSHSSKQAMSIPVHICVCEPQQVESLLKPSKGAIVSPRNGLFGFLQRSPETLLQILIL
jgi:hypothetical protein